MLHFSDARPSNARAFSVSASKGWERDMVKHLSNISQHGFCLILNENAAYFSAEK